MYEGVLEGLKWIVIGALFAALGIIAVLCTYYVLRWQAFQPFFHLWRRKEKNAEEEDEDSSRREAVRSWFWGGR